MTGDATIAGKRIFIGLSGGVDSAVSAALLKQKGANLVAVFIKGWYPPELPCTWAEDRRDAMRVAARLQIPFHTLDASDTYKRAVIDYLIAEYREGRTPNPDIMCNREVKFGAFHAFAATHNADAIATGHYAKTKNGKLFRAKNTAKDQSYFLWAVPSEALKHTLFPLGGFEDKAEVRNLAERFNLPVARKRDSQGICFLGAISVDDFLRAELGSAAGKAVDTTGKEVGRHDGAVLRTLGERVALEDAEPGPWYVVRKNLTENVLVVSKERAQPTSVVLRISDDNWFDTPNEGMQAQFRYHGPLVSGRYDAATKIFTPSETLPEPAAAGQSLVFYSGDACVGGGIIATSD